ncbi:DUF2300 domain-containing protein [Shigella flexneri]
MSWKLPERFIVVRLAEHNARYRAGTFRGLHFAPQRLHIGADVGGSWQQGQAPVVSVSEDAEPETSVTVKSLLDRLHVTRAKQSSGSLTGCGAGRGEIGVASMLGSRVRVRSWSWFADDKQEIRQGGFAGW